MNQRTAKLIRKHCTAEKLNYRAQKKAWNRTPRHRRAALRAEIKDRVESLR